MELKKRKALEGKEKHAIRKHDRCSEFYGVQGERMYQYNYGNT